MTPDRIKEALRSARDRLGITAESVTGRKICWREDWIDIHAHFLPAEAEEVHHRRLHGLREGCWCIEAAPRWDVEAALSYMNRTGIAMQMSSNIPKTLAEILHLQ